MRRRRTPSTAYTAIRGSSEGGADDDDDDSSYINVAVALLSAQVLHPPTTKQQRPPTSIYVMTIYSLSSVSHFHPRGGTHLVVGALMSCDSNPLPGCGHKNSPPGV